MPDRRLRPLAGALVPIVCLAAFAASAHADEEPPATTGYVQEVEVTSSRDDIPAGDSPVAVSTMTDDELVLTRSASSFPDLLSFLPGVMVQKTTRGFGSPYVRGFTGFRALTTIDGVRLNNSTFRDGPNQYNGTIDLFDVEQVEVQRGPGSVLHGSDAVGGTVQVVPYVPLPGTAGLGTLRADYRGATQERSHALHLGYDTGGERWAAAVGATYRTMDDLDAGGATGRQAGTGFDERGVDGNVSFMLGATTRLTFLGQQFRQDDVSRYHRTVNSPGWEGTAPGTDLANDFDEQRQLFYGRLAFEPASALCRRGQLTVSLHRQQEENDRLDSRSRRTVQGFDVDTLGVDLQLNADAGRHHLTYGVEGYLDAVDSYRENYAADGSLASVGIQGPIGDDARYWTAGVYVEDRIAVSRRGVIQAGARYNAASLEADRVQDPVTGGVLTVSDDWSAVVGDLHYMHLVGRRSNLFVGVSQGFRAPGLADMTTYDLAEQGQVEVPSLDLDPERFLSYELGVKGTGTRVAGQVSLFRTEISDMIDRYFTGSTLTLPNGQTADEVRKANVSEGWVQGLELEGSVRVSRGLLLAGHFFATRGEADTTVIGEDGVPRLERWPLSRVAPATGALRAHWSPASDRYWLEAELVAAARQDRLSYKDTKDTTRIPPGGTPGYAVGNLRVGFRLREVADVLVLLRNVTDEDYRIHGSGINESGRGLELGIRLRLGP